MYKTIYYKGEALMPVYYTENVFDNGLEIKLNPTGKRRFMRSYIPYLTGDLLDCELEIKSRSGKVNEYKYEWQLQDLIPETKNFRVVANRQGSFISSSKGKAIVQLGIHHLVQYEAEYHLILTLEHNEKKEIHTLLNFYALARDVYRMKWLTALMSGFIGAIIGLIAGIILAKLN